MAIEITIVNSPDNVDIAQPSHTFPDDGGTLGRGSNNFWILDDPNKYMSSVHAKIELVAGQYILTDLSTNGTFINGAAEPIGKGNEIKLAEGDLFTISDYEFAVKLPNGQTAADPFAAKSNDPFADFDTPLPAQDDFLASPSTDNNPFASGVNQSSSMGLGDDSSLSSFDAPETDPLAILNAPSTNDPFADPLGDFGAEESASDLFSNDGFNQQNNADPFTAPTSTTISSNNVATDAVNWPSANKEASLIPDDWDDEDLMGDFAASPNSPFATPIAAAPVAAIKPAAVKPAPFQAPPVQPPAQQTPVQQAPQQAPIQSAPAQVPVQPQAPAAVVNPVAEQSSPAAHSQQDYDALALKNQQLQQEIAQLKQQLVEAQAANNSAANAQANTVSGGESRRVVNAMGLSRWNLDENKVAEINETVGHLMRETMQGMMRVLKFRKKIKEEFRINVTTIQSVENNPLKFSANVDDAMENMFIKENNAYKAPVDAVKEGFQGIAEHQVAVIAGMQAAFRGMIDRFDPSNLESRFEKYKSTSLLRLGQKGKRWSAYTQYHQGLVENLDDSFQHLFGYDFVQAYEAQMQRLISERLSSPDNENNQTDT